MTTITGTTDSPGQSPPYLMEILALEADPSGQGVWVWSWWGTGPPNNLDVTYPGELDVRCMSWEWAAWIVTEGSAAKGGWQVVAVFPDLAGRLGVASSGRVFVPEKGSTFAACASAADLAEQLAAYRGAVGVHWRSSGAVTSDLLLYQLGRRYGARQVAHAEAPPVAVRDPRGRPPLGQEASGFAYARPPVGVEQRARYCHTFDINGQYLAAAGDALLPTGPAEHYPTRDPLVLHDRGEPGYWRVALEIPALRDPAGLLPDLTGRRHNGELWVTTPTLELLYQRDAVAAVLEAWVWRSERPVALRPWYERLRDARAALAGTERAEVARQAVKDTYAQGIGRLGSPMRRRGTDDPLYHPYGMHSIWAEARCRWWRRLERLGQAPVAINVDAAAWLTNTPDPGRFAARIGLGALGNRLGQLKHTGTIPGNAARPLLTRDDPRPLFNRINQSKKNHQ